MLIKQVDDINLEPPKRALNGLLDVPGPAVQTCRSGPMITATQIEAEFGGDDDLLAEGSKGFPDEVFVRERTINFSCVEKRDPAIHGCVEKSRHLLFVLGRAVGKTHAHAPEPERRYFQFALA